MIEELRWARKSERYWWVVDGPLDYVARMGKDGVWRVKMKGESIGLRGGFASFAVVKDYVDWGGTPNRMGYDRETGELR